MTTQQAERQSRRTDLNRTCLTGNLSADPSLVFVGTKVKVTARLVVNGRNGSSTGFNLELWGKQAKTFFNLCQKGTFLYIEGESLKWPYTGKDGKPHIWDYVRVTRFEAIARRKPGQLQSTTPAETTPAKPAETAPSTVPAPASEGADDDIPF